MTDSRSPIRFSQLASAMEDPVIDGLMAKALAQPDLLSLGAGFTDNALLPLAEMREVAEAVLSDEANRPVLQYGTNQGRPELRRLLCERLASVPGEEAAAFDPARTIIGNGSQQLLYLTVQAICDPGDIVLVESPSYFVFLELLKGLGVHALAMPCHDDGSLDFDQLPGFIDELAQSPDRERLKLLYLVGWYANPSGRCVPEADKQRLAQLLAERGLLLPTIEDAAYRDLYYAEPHPARTILSLPEFAGFPCLYAGTFTKPLATGLKVGYGVANDPGWLRAMLRIKSHHDFGTSNFSQAIVERFLVEKRFEPFLQRIRPRYAEKMALLSRTLTEAGLREAGWAWHEPEGGLLMWARGPHGLDTGLDSDFCRACLDKGVLYVPGALFQSERSDLGHCVRLSTGALDDAGLVEAARRFAEVALAFSVVSTE